MWERIYSLRKESANRRFARFIIFAFLYEKLCYISEYIKKNIFFRFEDDRQIWQLWARYLDNEVYGISFTTTVETMEEKRREPIYFPLNVFVNANVTWRNHGCKKIIAKERERQREKRRVPVSRGTIRDNSRVSEPMIAIKQYNDSVGSWSN